MKVMDCASVDKEDVRRMSIVQFARMGICLVNGDNLLLECQNS